MRKQLKQACIDEISTKRFLRWTVLFAFALLLVSLAAYQWLRSPVEVEIQLSDKSDYTIRVTRFVAVEDVDEFPEIITLQMSRWQAWWFDRKEPMYVVDRNSGYLLAR